MTLTIDPEFKAIKPIHPVANIFPMMQTDEFQELKDDIRQNGLQEPIWLHPDGRIIDGRNRYKACVEVGVTPTFRTWNEQGSLVAFVVSLNLKRRHLTPLQKAAVGVDMLPMLEEEAKERQREAGGDRKSAEYQRSLPQNFAEAIAPQLLKNHKPDTPEPFNPFEQRMKAKQLHDAERIQIESRQKAAELTGTNRQYISDMKRYKDEAPEIYEAAKEGKVNGNQAKALLCVAPEKRKEFIEKVVAEDLSGNEIKKAIKREEQQEKRQQIAADLAEPTKQISNLADVTTTYRVILADPPWFYGNDYTQAMPGSTRPEDHYAAMPLQAICDLPVKRMTQDDAVLFLWVTSPLLEESFQVVKAWGFHYKTSFVWDKIKHNFGHYNSVRHELLLVCTKGSCTPDHKELFDSVVSIEREEHSAKPERFREIIDTLYPFGNRIELFARSTRANWDSWGNQL